MKTAKALAHAVTVVDSYKLDGALWVHLPCADYDALQSLPHAIEYDGKICGRTGWNSDHCIAYYSSARKIAFAV